jgi:molybdopterin-guanine dinucleotide biosynthesis protein A
MLDAMGDGGEAPVGVVLAGGQGRRLGGRKAMTALGGRPLVSFPVAAMRATLPEVVVVAKSDTELPAGLVVWREPEEPQHPVVGILHALRCAGGRAVVVCAGDMPFVSVGVLSALAACRVTTVAVHAGELVPVLGRYGPEAQPGLESAAGKGNEPLRAVVSRLAPDRFVVTDARVVFNVNTPADLTAARAMLADEPMSF